MRFLVCVFVLLAACKNEQPHPHASRTAAPPVSAANATELAQRVIAAASPTCDGTRLLAVFDFDAFAERMIGHLGSDGVPMRTVISAFGPEKLGPLLCGWLGDREQLRIIPRDDAAPLIRRLIRVPRTRTVAAQYIRLELVPAAGGAKIADLYSYVAGEALSEVAADIIQSELHRGASGGVRTEDVMLRVRRLRQEGKAAEALSALDELSPEARATRPIRVIRVGVAQEASAEQYKEALDDLARHYPDDASVAFLEVDGAILHHDYDAALRYLEIVEKEVGKDAFQEAVRAKIYQLRARDGDLELALAAAEGAINQEPTLTKPWLMKLDVEVARKDWPAALDVMTHLEKSLGSGLVDEVVAKSEFAGLVASGEFAEWRKQHPPPH
jgi:hypothetical protein